VEGGGGREGEVLSFVDLCHCERYCVKQFRLGLGAEISGIWKNRVSFIEHKKFWFLVKDTYSCIELKKCS